MPAKRDLTGQVFGRLTVVQQVAAGPVRWSCLCSCGGWKTVESRDLLSGHVRSCGCWQRDARYARARHGLARHGQVHPLHFVWRAMLARCYNSNNERYKNYGERGIRVCTRWHTFENFVADVGDRPPGRTATGRAVYSIERKDNDGHYEPGNVIWATQKQQANNTTRTRRARGGR